MKFRNSLRCPFRLADTLRNDRQAGFRRPRIIERRERAAAAA